jgi:hypothetical protein
MKSSNISKMTNIIDRTGHYSIAPTYDLNVTAKMVSDSLGISLNFDDSGFYEEYPAFKGRGKGFDIALLGIPKPEDDLSEPPTDTYNLRITVGQVFKGLETTDLIDAMILKSLCVEAGLVCTVEGWGT